MNENTTRTITVNIELRGRGLAAFTTSAKNLASPQARSAARMALNDTGRKTNTVVKRSLVKQTGIKYGAVSKGVRQDFASNARLEYHMIGTGKHFGLTDFNARQTKAGVSAAPWNKRHVFAHTFIVQQLGNQVFIRKSKARLPIKKLFGPAIPREMARDEVPRQFNMVGQSTLQINLVKQLARLVPK